jgi:hypothetical protein
VRDLVKWGIDTGNTTPQQMRETVAHRQELAIKLIEAGVSQRQAAKLLGVSVGTINSDVQKLNGKRSETERATNKPATKSRRASIAAAKSAKGVSQPDGKYRIIYADPPWDYGAHSQPAPTDGQEASIGE